MTKKEKEMLKEMLKGNESAEEDFVQICEFEPHIKFYLRTTNGVEIKITQTIAKKLLPTEDYLRCLDRATFHWNTARQISSEIYIYFSASDYWNKILHEGGVR